jgi:hypothetical protein
MEAQLPIELLLRLVTKPRDKTLATPKFNVVTIDKAPGLFSCLGVVGAYQRLEPHETPV